MDIRSLASHLGLSIGTVSRALNDRKDVSPATRQRVVDAAARHGYTPNQSGRTLRIGRTATIGFMLTLEHDSAVHGDPFFMALLEGVQRGLTEHHLDLIVLLAHKGENGADFLKRHVARGTVDGWLLSATQYDDDRIAFLLDRNIPFVALGRSAGAKSSFAWIDLDFERLIGEAMELFLGDGHRRIGLIAPSATINNSHVVVDSFRSALRAGHLAEDAALIYQGNTDETDGQAAVTQLLALPDPPTALLLIGETAPVGAYRALRAVGLEPGRDVAVIGLRDNPACRALSPDLTCFSLALDDLGLALAQAIVVKHTQAHDPSGAPDVQRLWPMNLRMGVSHRIGPLRRRELNAQAPAS